MICVTKIQFYYIGTINKTHDLPQERIDIYNFLKFIISKLTSPSSLSVHCEYLQLYVHIQVHIQTFSISYALKIITSND